MSRVLNGSDSGPVPQVSVLMPVYNGAAYLAEAIDSILTQTFSDFEVVAIDDGSKDDSLAILTAAAQRDARVRVWTKPNGGIVEALNLGLDQCRGVAIARMDCDDISTPTRLQRQWEHLQANPDIDACGCWMEVFSPSEVKVKKWDCEDARIRAMLPFRSSFPHPASMFRRTFFDAGLRYRFGYPHAEDYDLWARASHSKRFHTLPEVLYRYRQHEAQVTIKHEMTTRQTSARIRKELLTKLFQGDLRSEDLEIHEAIIGRVAASHARALRSASAWLGRLIEVNRRAMAFPLPAFDEIVAEHWFEYCRANSGKGWACWSAYAAGPVRPTPNVNRNQQIKMLARCLLRKQPEPYLRVLQENNS